MCDDYTIGLDIRQLATWNSKPTYSARKRQPVHICIYSIAKSRILLTQKHYQMSVKNLNELFHRVHK